MKNLLFKKLLLLVIILLVSYLTLPTNINAQQNKRWVSSIYYNDNNIDTIWNNCDYMKNGDLHIDPSFAHGGNYFGRFFLNDTFCLKNNFTVETKLKNSTDFGFSSFDVYFHFFGENNSYMMTSFMGDQSAQEYTLLAINGTQIKNNSNLILSTSDWNILKFKLKDRVLYFSNNNINNLILPYNYDFCYIKEIVYSMKGCGYVDWLKVYDENDNLIYFDDFLDCQNIVNAPDCTIKFPIDFIITYNNPLCEGSLLTLTTNPSLSGYALNWTGPNGFISKEQSPTINNVKTNMSGIYICSISDTLNCANRTAQCSVKISPKPDATISSSTNFILCNGDSSILKVINPKDNYSYKWSTGDASSQIIVRKPGQYFVTVTDTSGCESISNIINITTEGGGNIDIETVIPEGGLYFDSITYPQVKCKRLLLKNTGNAIITLQNVLLLSNVEFSIPQSQFPFIIQPGGTAGLEICYTPSNKGIQSDTLVIMDTCFNIKLPLIATGLPEELQGMSKCNENINITTQFKDKFNFSIPIPNPATDIIEIQFSGGNNIKNHNIKELNIVVDIFDLYGNLVLQNLKTENNNIQSLSSRSFFVDMSKINNGYYFLRIKILNNINIFPLIILR